MKSCVNYMNGSHTGETLDSGFRFDAMKNGNEGNGRTSSITGFEFDEFILI